ncbi:hypothetical protein MYCTH_2311824 [Thermothelomyces thermophilus ATCC 42464]|uniref:Uncharacterized protein n=1 Tax=Thermothelomyces thermophilus (strain ATCC 42464 / BCRC 31852 / DSM 1799) TaxID=573729 RepID=G2QPP3_THET4|nr:uncharacterized protein MYCTH_2311824 [Thermothelomyces thermophilus ATCC 42464]AEO61556.1 hypothetical protein MYCTH_2311824 [Thermothelomyces thermophilus ATCC 42464]
MRRNLLDTTRDLEKARKRMQELEREAADRERELLRLKTDLDAIGQDQTAALAALKSSDELISESLRTELEATRKQLAQRAFELEQMKDQLMGALVSKDKVQKRLDDALASSAADQSHGAQAESSQAKGKKEDAEKIEKLRAALKQKIEVSNGAVPTLDSPYMASFLGTSFPDKAVWRPTPASCVPRCCEEIKPEKERTRCRREGWLGRLLRAKAS